MTGRPHPLIDSADSFSRHFQVSRETLARLNLYESLLRTWQPAVNLVAPATLDLVWGRHFADSAQLAALVPKNAVTLVELSHAGWPNGAGTPRGTVQRVSYRLEERTLIREYWNVTDPTLANVPVARRLLTQVERIEIRYMNAGREWVTQWPALGSAGDTGLRSRPMAVEITIVLTDYGELKRLIEVAG